MMLALGCEGSTLAKRAHEDAADMPDAPDEPTWAPRIPHVPDGGLMPSRARIAGDRNLLTDVETCRSCHEDVAASWDRSAHARSSFENPWYRTGVLAFIEARGRSASRFCGGCHDPVPLALGLLDEPLDPEAWSSHAGVTCLVCHSMRATTSDGNASFELDLSDVPIPDPDDETQVAAHVARVQPMDTSALCGSCHRSFVGDEIGSPHHIDGIDDIGAWRASAYAGAHGVPGDTAVEEETCTSCHMAEIPAEADLARHDGRVHSHAVRAAQTALGDEEHLLENAVTIDVPAAQTRRWAYPAAAAEGRVRALDLVVRNTSVGHRFPGGTRDLQDTWVEVKIAAEDGTVLAASTEDDAYRFRSVLLDDEGRPETNHFVQRFSTPGFDRTLAPRDAVTLRYTLPRPLRTPFRVEARVLHRRHPRAFSDLACAEQESVRGQAYTRAARRMGRVPLDACAAEPVTLVAEWTGRVGANDTASRPLHERLYDLALGRSHALQERLDEVRPVIAAAREAGGAPRALDVLLASVAARQGRLEEALSLLERHEGADVSRVRGRAYAQVWRWEDAAEAYEDVVARSPGDPRAYRDLAEALGSAGHAERAAEIASRGLAFAPRNASLLRSQSLALDALSHDDAARSREAYLRHRRPDEAPAMLRRCEDQDPLCARDRQPLPTIPLQLPAP